MILIVHRGSKQIGGSCIELVSNSGQRILLDAGLPLTKPDGSEWPNRIALREVHKLHETGALPRIRGFPPDSTSDDILALILSHAHLDHYGLAHLAGDRLPVYASRGTQRILSASKLFIPHAHIPGRQRNLDLEPMSIGQFKAQAIPVDHVSPDSRAILVECDNQRVLYSGDLRAHGLRKELFEKLPDYAGKVDVLILEGTTIGQPAGSHGYYSEKDVENKLLEFLEQKAEIVCVISSGQNADRSISIYQAARAAKRFLVLDLYQAFIHAQLEEILPDIPQYHWPGVKVKFVHYHREQLLKAGHSDFIKNVARRSGIRKETIAKDPQRYVLIARSSSATVALLKYLRRSTSVAVVWSMWKGYLKKDQPLQRYCEEENIPIRVMHSGGHAHPEDLAQLIKRIQPGVIVPVHTENPEKFTELAPNIHPVQDGNPLDISELLNA